MSSLVNRASLVTALAMALVAGVVVFISASAAKFTKSVLLYHVIIWFVFFGLYMSVPGGFRAHFTMPGDEKEKPSAADIAYYTMITHSGAGYGDIYPKTTPARILVSTHLFFTILAIFNMVPLGKSVFSYAAYGPGG